MCGICGMTGKVDPVTLERMNSALVHRGPDSQGSYIGDNVGLAMRRLKVIDLVTGDQPVFNEDRSLCLVYNGEIYNFKELRGDLQARGHVFYTSGDTEVIVHLYEEYGRDFVTKLNGMFAFALFDKKQNSLILARDHLGIKPLYYALDKNSLFFASEIKSLLRAGMDTQLDPMALAHYFSYLYIPAPLSIFRNICKLPAGHMVTFKDGTAKTERYWKLDFSRDDRFFNEDDCKRQIKTRLFEAVKKNLVSDVPLGIFLSGGIDSSAVAAFACQAQGSKVKTFSIGFPDQYSSFNELQYSRFVAKRLGTEHQEYIVEPKIADILPKVAWYLDEPLADSSALLNYIIAGAARKDVTVALTGIGGDELFGGYPRYLGALLSLEYKKLPGFIRTLAAKTLSPFIREGLTSSNTGSRLKRFLAGGLLDDQSRYISWMRFFNKDQVAALLGGGFCANIGAFDPDKIFRDHLDDSNAKDYPDKIFSLDLSTYLCDDLLHLADRMSMAHSLELRVPFCDPELAQFVAGIPARARFKGFRLKGLLKEALVDVLPEEILKRPKAGFMAPVGRWLKEDLKDFTRDLLCKKNIDSAGILDAAAVDSILNAHFSGKQNYTHQVWAMLIFTLWHQAMFKDK